MAKLKRKSDVSMVVIATALFTTYEETLWLKFPVCATELIVSR
ncbi:hypothetical protein Nizo1839_0147 [Lactiplantibacillus plantarum]|nr:hypothetical protein SF2A35B_0886 [Lactiplantibacillus plantarum]KZT83637.1 hypothetical protein Nizo1839_0147 [Lactiplantibacillus plantarum]KZU10310.1 hypothetical protein Nizo2264_2918 [Lactiplantibacillus plantarum]